MRREHHHTKLKADYEHLLGRTWDLFKYGLEKEGKLKEALVNAWKTFERIADSDDLSAIKDKAVFMRDFTAKALKDESVEIDHEALSREGDNKLIFVGYTNGHQILYGAQGEGAFYSTTDNDCWIPLYMLERHEHRLQNTSGMDVTLAKVKTAQADK